MESSDPTTGDAFGAALRAFYEDEESYVIVERDDGWIGPSAGGELYFRSPDEWPERERWAIEQAEGRVLDVGCGAGRHALALQDRGHDVTAIDVSEAAVAVATERGVRDARVVDVSEGAEGLDETYDTVLTLGNNFGLVGTAERAPAVLNAIASVTKPDSRLLAESTDPTATDDEAHLAYHEFNRERGRLPGAVRQRIRFRSLATPWHDYLHAAPETMRDLVSGTPWSVEDIVDGEGGSYVARLERS